MSDSFDMDEIKTELTATVMSSRGGLPLNEIEYDYNKLTGKHLPYRKLGFKSLIEFIHNLETFIIDDTRSKTIVYALTNEKTKHIEEIINKHENPKKELRNKKNPLTSSYYKSDSSGSDDNYRENSRYMKNISIQKIRPMEFDEISANLKSIISSTDGILLQNIESEYIKLTGESLPHQKFGSPTLLDFIQFQGIYKIENRQSMIYVWINKTSTKHLKKQKTQERNPKYTNTDPTTLSDYKNNASGIVVSTRDNSTLEQKLDNSKYTNSEPTTLSDYKNNASGIFVSTRDNSTLEQKLDCSTTGIYQISTGQQPIKTLQPTIVEWNYKSYVTDQDRLQQLMKKYSSVREPPNASIFPPTEYTKNWNFIIEQLRPAKIYNKLITVTAVTSSSNLWVVSEDIKYDKNFLEMERELNNPKLSNNQYLAENLIIDHPYALYDNGKWQRVVVKYINLDGTVNCLFIDIGKSMDAINRNKIYLLHPAFYNICGQAVEIKLSNVKSIGGFPIINDILFEELLYKTCILEPIDVEKDPLTVNLIDMDSMEILNDIVLNTFLEKVTPILHNLECDPFSSIKAKVLSIEEGYLYLRLNDNDIMNSLENLLATDLFTGPYMKNIKHINLNNVYLTTYKLNLKGRVKVMHIFRNGQVKVFFIDYGKSDIVKVDELIDLDNIDFIIAQLPKQAVKVILNMFPPKIVTSNTVEVFFDILEKKLDVSLIILNKLVDDIPCVQLISDLYPCSLINRILHQRLENNKECTNIKEH